MAALFSKIKELMEKYNAFVQFVKFCIVGLSNTLISYGLYVAVLFIYKKAGIEFAYDYIVATVISFVLSVFWSFIWNRIFVFKNKDSFWIPLLKTYVSYSFTGLFLSSVLIWLWVDIIGLSKFIAPLINLVLTVPLNFILNKFWTFKK